jgi:hypothetical protein
LALLLAVVVLAVTVLQREVLEAVPVGWDSGSILLLQVTPLDTLLVLGSLGVLEISADPRALLALTAVFWLYTLLSD